ncbi:uncharacterized protein DSM5745_07887 [Aspergillus mulundensis]|uniref:Uncharacterized protein n=1 Tax=Aspergillus mulundensis TaxID=1810919 RepID=A0A3D8RF92_9EURO|nr:hypothetical protein DSM5745_07887 [Aspergillus mulundensis]RDW72715.1 hypothetical protein DSM5745_07887 [Aspergillus mulundensis]
MLDQAGVPNVIWGWLALGLHTADNGNREIEFVIADKKLDEAKRVLAAAGFTACTDTSCGELCEDRFPVEKMAVVFGTMDLATRGAAMGAAYSFDRYHPVPAVHYHVQGLPQWAPYELLSLHKQSAQLWWLPELKTDAPAPDDRNLTLTNSARLLTGNGRTAPFNGPGQYPMKVLLPWAFLEAVILLRCRDYGHMRDLHNLWRFKLMYFVPHDADVRDKLDPQFKPVWDALNQRLPAHVWNVHVPLGQLRRKLIAAGELPDIPTPNKAEKMPGGCEARDHSSGWPGGL